MASQWGRKETVIWPPQMPVWTYSAVAVTLFLSVVFFWQQYRHGLTALEQSYTTEYVRSTVGAQFKQVGTYRLLYLAGQKVKPRLALPVDFEAGVTRRSDGTVVPVQLTALPHHQGYDTFFRGKPQELNDIALYRWLHGAIYGGRSFVQVFARSFAESAALLVFLLFFSVRADAERFRVMKYGRVLRGPLMVDPKAFNEAHKNVVTLHDRLTGLQSLSRRIPGLHFRKNVFEVWGGSWHYSRQLAKIPLPVFASKPDALKAQGIGFKTTELRAMMRVPMRKEAQHFQIMGDTGVGKTQLIMQLLRQIRERGETAIVYDPACEYIQRFYDEKRGDIVLNPLDERCPYWGPAQEMRSNAEADAIAVSLYSPATDAKDEFFHQTPAQIFAHLLKKGPSPQQLAEWLADGDKVEALVKGTEMSAYIDRKAGPQRAGVLASLGLVAKSFRLLPTKEQGRGTWNARTWAEKRQGWIFITSRPPERETLRPLHSLWIDTLVMRLLTEPTPEQKKVWFVIDELASLQRLPQLHTAITENRKSGNPLVLGFQGKAQLEVIYGHLAETMLSSPATKIYMKTAEPKAAEWISEAIGKVEIERLKETKFDGSRSGRNFSMDRQIEPLVMGSEISGLSDRHAYLKLGNYVARFSFEYLDLPKRTPGYQPRVTVDGGMAFDPDTLEPVPVKPAPLAPAPASAASVSPSLLPAPVVAQPAAEEDEADAGSAPERRLEEQKADREFEVTAGAGKDRPLPTEAEHGNTEESSDAGELDPRQDHDCSEEEYAEAMMLVGGDDDGSGFARVD